MTKAFSGYESRAYEDIGNKERYERVCTDEEALILQADAKRASDAEREEDEEL